MKKNNIKILFIGDIVGKPGRAVVKHFLPIIKDQEKIDLVFANGENLAHGSGMTYEKYEEMILSGIDYFTSGNHIWSKEDFAMRLNEKNIKVLRPANYSNSASGRGIAGIKINKTEIILANLIGQVFMNDEVNNPFETANEIIKTHKNKVIVVDIHAEATSEKVALGLYLDGKVAAVLGTHTHIQTADDKILRDGTAYITDVGMCGPSNSVLGIEKEIIIEKFLTGLPKSHRVASGDSIFQAVVVEIDKDSKKAVKIKRISEVLKV
jgi:hypothetical protein